eukprot:Selendium_serpulae@DN5586_c0_g1_i3.p1
MSAEGGGWTFSGPPGAPDAKAAKVVAVLGAQWGDEGKGKIIDLLADRANVVARFNGGANAGHTIVVGAKKFSVHLLPSGVLHAGTRCVIGHGVVVHLQSLIDEIDSLKEVVPDLQDRVFVSSRAHLVLDIHKDVDGLMEQQRVRPVLESDAESTGSPASGASLKPLGTTRRGIGPAYACKAHRFGLRAGDLTDWEAFEQKYAFCVSTLSAMYGIEDYDAAAELSRHRLLAQRLHIVDTVSLLHEALAKGQSILVEGANAAMLDLDLGTYPFVTSSNTTIGGMCTGLGLPPRRVEHVVMVAKAYTTRVGAGPMLSELPSDAADAGAAQDDADGMAIGRHLQSVGREFGTTTGRARRVGWFDAQAARFAVLVNGCDELAVTKLDVLTGLTKLRICVGYTNKATGVALKPSEYPSQIADLLRCEAVYRAAEGWATPIEQCRTFEELPDAARRYVDLLEEAVGVRIAYIGVGPDRAAVIRRH